MCSFPVSSSRKDMHGLCWDVPSFYRLLTVPEECVLPLCWACRKFQQREPKLIKAWWKRELGREWALRKCSDCSAVSWDMWCELCDLPGWSSWLWTISGSWRWSYSIYRKIVFSYERLSVRQSTWLLCDFFRKHWNLLPDHFTKLCSVQSDQATLWHHSSAVPSAQLENSCWPFPQGES